MRPVVVLGIASAAVLIIATGELFVAQVIDLMHPGHLLSLLDSPPLYYAYLGATIILGLALGMLAVVALYAELAKEVTSRVANGPRKPLR